MHFRPASPVSLRWLTLSALGLVALLLAGCRRYQEPLSLGPWHGGAQAVPLEVLHGRGGTTLAVVKVHINGQGPFDFVLDTGASTSGVDNSIAEALNLPRGEHKVQVAGVAEVTNQYPVLVDHWRVGNVELPASTLVTLDMPNEGDTVRLQGLLGSDILNQFGLIRIDYERGLLVLPADNAVSQVMAVPQRWSLVR